jgi:hypothetical protein
VGAGSLTQHDLAAAGRCVEVVALRRVRVVLGLRLVLPRGARVVGLLRDRQGHTAGREGQHGCRRGEERGGSWVIDVVLMMTSKKWLVIRRSRLQRLSGIRPSAMDDSRTRYRVCPARPDSPSLVGPTEQR